MADFKLDLDSAGMRTFLQSQAIGDAMLDVAKEGVQYAQSIAPVASGAYRDSIKAEQVTVPVTKKNEPRAGAMIYADVPYAVIVESNQHVLTRTADYLNRGA